MGIRFEIYPNPDPSLLKQDEKPIFTQEFGPDQPEAVYNFLIPTELTQGEGILENAKPINFRGDTRNAVEAFANLEDDVIVIYESGENLITLRQLGDGKFQTLDVYALTDNGLHKAAFISDPSQTYQGSVTEIV